MTRFHWLFAAALALVVAAPAFAGIVSSGMRPENQKCLENRDIRAKNLSQQSGYFAQTPKGWWRNAGPTCAAYRRDMALFTQSTQNRQCQGDLVRVFDPISKIEFGSCVLGDWERVSEPPEK